MKKIIVILLTLAMIWSMAACGAAETVDVAAKASVEDTAASVPASDSKEAGDSGEAAAEQAEEAFEQIVVIDNEICTFTITEVESDGLWGYTWKVYLENKTDKNLMFSMDNVAVNGMVSDPFWASSVSAGMKSNEEISWYDDFEAFGIEKVTLVEFDLSVYDEDDWMAEYLVDERVTVYPMGEEAVGALYQREAEETDIVLVDNEDCSVILTKVDPNGEWGYTWELYLENKTDKNLMFSMDRVSVNNLMCDPYWASSVSAGMKSNEEISWYDDFETLGIDNATLVEFDLSVYDEDDWMAEYLVNETITVYPMGEDVVGELYQREAKETDLVLVDNDACSIIATEFDPNGTWGYTMTLYLENKSDRALSFSIEDAAVNGFMCDPFWATTIPAGKMEISEVSWFEDDFVQNGIVEVEEISLCFNVYDDESWEDVLTETFTINP